jgi:hypothetical protein
METAERYENYKWSGQGDFEFGKKSSVTCLDWCRWYLECQSHDAGCTKGEKVVVPVIPATVFAGEQSDSPTLVWSGTRCTLDPSSTLSLPILGMVTTSGTHSYKTRRFNRNGRETRW